MLEKAGKKEEAQGKRLEAEAQKTKAINQLEYAQKISTMIKVEKGLEPPEQTTDLQLIRGFS